MSLSIGGYSFDNDNWNFVMHASVLSHKYVE
jgi:hypothetical protein